MCGRFSSVVWALSSGELDGGGAVDAVDAVDVQS
jgi:hypothetical protein